MAARDTAITYLGSFNLSGAFGQVLSGAVIGTTDGNYMSGSRIEIIPLANGMQVGVFKVVVS